MGLMWLILQPILGVLKAIPWWAYVIAACLAWGGWQRHRALSAAKSYQQAQIEAAKATEAALAENIRETARRLAEQQKATHDAELKYAKARAAAGGAAAAAARLRERLVAIRAASAPTSDPAAAGASTTDRLADILGQCADRYRTVAASADSAVIAGLACEAHYEALTHNPPKGKP
jgi:Protein of unknown function (DUF2514)